MADLSLVRLQRGTSSASKGAPSHQVQKASAKNPMRQKDEGGLRVAILGGCGIAVPFQRITPFSPSMTRAGVTRRLRRSSIIDGCAAA